MTGINENAPKITAITPKQAASIFSAVYKRRITADKIQAIAERAELLRADGTFSMVEYVAFLSQEVARG